MKCINCGSESWENVDQFRIKPSGMSICTKCGMVSYPDKWKSKEDIKKYYSSGDYRKAPTAGNFFSGNKKISYHHEFLNEYFEQWKSKESFCVADVGAAMGMFLAWFKSVVPNAEILGTEWDMSFRRNAFQEYGIRLSEELDYSKKYDLICFYNVAEHVIDFDVELKKYIECLKDDGHIYLSVPIWFDMFFNFGPGNNDLEYYYDTNHINQWTRKIFQSILNKCGLKIVKENFTYYGDTYLCAKGETKEIVLDNPTEIKEKMLAIKECFLLFTEKKYKESIEKFTANPMAWRGNYEMNRKDFHNAGEKTVEEYMQQACGACQNSSEIIAMCADIMMRYGKWERAIQFWRVALTMRPGVAQYYSMMAQCFRGLFDKTKDQKYLVEARNICRNITKIAPESLSEALTWIYHDNAKMEMEA